LTVVVLFRGNMHLITTNGSVYNCSESYFLEKKGSPKNYNWPLGLQVVVQDDTIVSLLHVIYLIQYI